MNDSVGRWGWDCDEFEQCAVGGGPDQEYAVLSVVFVFDYPYGVFPRVCDVSMCDAVLVGAGKNFHTVNCKLTADLRLPCGRRAYRQTRLQWIR